MPGHFLTTPATRPTTQPGSCAKGSESHLGSEPHTMDQAPRAGCDGRSCQPAGTYVPVVVLGRLHIMTALCQESMVLFSSPPAQLTSSH